jgi:hypothetical protein
VEHDATAPDAMPHPSHIATAVCGVIGNYIDSQVQRTLDKDAHRFATVPGISVVE